MTSNALSRAITSPHSVGPRKCTSAAADVPADRSQANLAPWPHPFLQPRLRLTRSKMPLSSSLTTGRIQTSRSGARVYPTHSRPQAVLLNLAPRPAKHVDPSSIAAVHGHGQSDKPRRRARDPLRFVLPIAGGPESAGHAGSWADPVASDALDVPALTRAAGMSLRHLPFTRRTGAMYASPASTAVISPALWKR